VTLLSGAHVAVLGDSVARLFYAALLQQAGLGEGECVVGGHQSFQHALAGSARSSFYWAPYEANMTSILQGWAASGEAPDVAVMGASLWHMLHNGDAPARRSDLRSLRRAVHRLRLVRKQTRTLFFWMSTSNLVAHKLPSDHKRARLTVAQIERYDADSAAELLMPRGPCLLLDTHRVTRDCGADCTTDGMHYVNSTYAVLLQHWANSIALLHRRRETRKTSPSGKEQ
jgi:hypothetical protein